MKQIAVLTCLQACNVCTGASCFRAWNARERGFAPYGEEDAALVAFFHCNGCDKDPESDPGMIEKLDRLQKIGVDMVHTGVCTIKSREDQTQCSTITKILDMLHQRGIKTVHGTH